MRIQVFSDIHLEFADYSAPIDTKADVVVFAGDVFTRNRSVQWLEAQYKNLKSEPEFLYVLGNHEGYSGYLPYAFQQIRSAVRNRHIHLLDNQSIVIGGVKFIGSTLWSDFKLNGDRERDMTLAGYMMNDYRQIRMNRKGFRRMQPADTLDFHNRAVSFIESELQNTTPQKRDRGPVVVISHHAPSLLSLSSGIISEQVSAAYASDLTRLMKSSEARRAPDLWIHGHIHASCDYLVENTRVVSNPRGYASYGYGNNPDFEDVFVVELNS